MPARYAERPLRIFVQITFYTLLVILAGILIRPFWEALVWGIVLAFVTWPTYRQLFRFLKGNRVLAPFAMLVIDIAVLAVPLTLIFRAAAIEGAHMLEEVRAWLATDPLPDLLERFPLVATLWETTLRPYVQDTARIRETLNAQALTWLRALAGAGTNLFQLVLAFFTLFFLYRNGETYALKTRRVLKHFLGEDIDRLIYPVRETTRAVFFGVILAALSQGAAAGVGYALFGLPSPVLLGILTGILALLPFGATVIWVPGAAWLVLQGNLWMGIGLLLWGMLVISSIDNLVRPLFISGTVRLPYLQVFFAFLGGLAAFGLLGLFLGPAILSVWMVLWEEWSRPANEGSASAEPSK